MRGVKWEDPPPDGRRAGNPKFDGFWDELRANPKRWARYPGAASSVAKMRVDHPDFEFLNRTVTGKRVAFVRYVGEDAP